MLPNACSQPEFLSHYPSSVLESLLSNVLSSAQSGIGKPRERRLVQRSTSTGFRGLVRTFGLKKLALFMLTEVGI